MEADESPIADLPTGGQPPPVFQVRSSRALRAAATSSAALAATALVLIACGGAAGGPIQLELQTLNDSGVTGNVTLTPLSDGRTKVVVVVDAAGHDDMPAHIHPGTCDELVPQPKYPLQNVLAGRSTTDVPVVLDELLQDTVALNLHASNSDMQTYTACVNLHAE
jgi:hypothetical protein